MEDDSHLLIRALIAAVASPEEEEINYKQNFARQFMKVYYGDMVVEKIHEILNDSQRLLEPVMRYVMKELNDITGTLIALITFGNRVFCGLRKTLNELNDKIKPLEDKLARVELHLSSTLLEIKNIPINHTETKENLMKLVLLIATKLEADTQQTDIKNIFLAKNKDHPKRSIVVDFYTMLLKEDFLLHYKNCGKKRLTTRSLNIEGPANRILILENPSA